MIELNELKPVPVEFIGDKTTLSWREAIWGYERGWLGWRSLVELAQSQLAANGADIELLGRLRALGKDDSHEAGDIARLLATAETGSDNPTQKWLYIVLSWLFSKREEISDYWTVIEEIYAEFDYPSAIKKFVRYEPVSPEDKAAWSSYTAPEGYMLDQWRKYLEEASKKYGADH